MKSGNSTLREEHDPKTSSYELKTKGLYTRRSPVRNKAHRADSANGQL